MNIFVKMRKILFFDKIKNKRTKPDTSQTALRDVDSRMGHEDVNHSKKTIS